VGGSSQKLKKELEERVEKEKGLTREDPADLAISYLV
jgi:hypothetical protein